MDGQGLQRLSACALFLTVIPWAAFPVVVRGNSPNESPCNARSANFLVHVSSDVVGDRAPSDTLAKQVAQRAEQLRREIALEWLGAELPTAESVNLITIKVNAQLSIGRTLPTLGGGGHLVWIVGTEQEATGTLLAHEVLHAVVADRFGKDFPAWANEGLASIYDSEKRHRIRRRILRDATIERLWPDLKSIMSGEIRTQSQYAAAASITQFLLERGTAKQFLQFVQAGQFAKAENVRGWDSVLKSFYSITDTNQLQQLWQRWVAQQLYSQRIALR